MNASKESILDKSVLLSRLNFAMYFDITVVASPQNQEISEIVNLLTIMQAMQLKFLSPSAFQNLIFDDDPNFISIVWTYYSC